MFISEKNCKHSFVKRILSRFHFFWLQSIKGPNEITEFSHDNDIDVILGLSVSAIDLDKQHHHWRQCAWKYTLCPKCDPKLSLYSDNFQVSFILFATRYSLQHLLCPHVYWLLISRGGCPITNRDETFWTGIVRILFYLFIYQRYSLCNKILQHREASRQVTWVSQISNAISSWIGINRLRGRYQWEMKLKKTRNILSVLLRVLCYSSTCRHAHNTCLRI